MNNAAAAPSPHAPRWLAGAAMALLVIPFHPLWIDAEQVRRALLLVAAGVALLACPRLPAVRGERWLWAFLGALLLSAAARWTGDVWFRAADEASSFQPWDAAYRLAHWLALLVVVRLGAAAPEALTGPLPWLLLMTSAFGLLQRLGLADLDGYGVEREPVTTLGNLNVAAEWTAIAAAGVAALLAPSGIRGRGVGLAALAIAGAYLVANGSRSGLVAMPLALLALAALQRREPLGERIAPMLAMLLGAAAMAIVAAAAPIPPPPAPQPAAPSNNAVSAPDRAPRIDRSAATLAVRWEIAKATARLVADAPVFGYGPGQFALHYPRVRSQAEIEQSSLGRSFATEVRTAHDDWLELLIDGGAVALLLFAAALLALQRKQADKRRLVPLFALLLLMLVRAPLWNAPAAATALLLAGASAPAIGPTGPWHTLAARLLGAALALLAVPVLLAHFAMVGYVDDVRDGRTPNVAAVVRASAWMPYEARWEELLTRDRLAAATTANDAVAAANLGWATSSAARALQLRPHHPQLYLNLGEALARQGKVDDALAVTRQGLRLDEGNPELRVLASVAEAQRGRLDAAILAVAETPHPTLRAQLATHFAQLEQVCSARGDELGVLRFRIERHVTAAIDGLGDTSPTALQTTSGHVQQALQAMREADRKDDGRALVLGALHRLDLGKEQESAQLGELVGSYPPLPRWQRELFGPQLDRLRALPSWQGYLGAAK
ncbi:MAG: tetratricopeptide repeat protein [Planctomycetes bacterium]|nr:tetratricopeptide repeat protein [Planctomycetota bacterium]